MFWPYRSPIPLGERGLLLAHGDYYLPSLRLEDRKGECVLLFMILIYLQAPRVIVLKPSNITLEENGKKS
jgi:hypothetical protein